MKLLLDGIETDRLRFRLVRESDYELWLPFFKDTRTSLHWIEPKESPETACRNWIQKQFYRYENNLGGMNALIEKQSGRFIGYCGLLVQTVDQTKEIEIAYSLLPQFWNNGYASEAAKASCNFAFENQLADSLISIISVTNKPSQRVAIKNGLSLGKTTMYKGNEVNIYRISNLEWTQLRF